MNNLLKTLLIMLIASGIFALLLNLLNRSNPEIFSFIDKIPERWKGKWFIRWIVLMVLMLIVAVLVVIAGLNDTLGTIIISFFIALTDLIFRKPKKIN